MNIAPKAQFIRSLRAERGDVVRVCGEAVDNAFDALADSIDIEINQSEIKFTDDGDGILLKNIPALFTYGDHVALRGTSLGRFGVGIFVQAINAADAMEVRTVSADGCFLARVNWRTVMRDGFDVDDPVRLPVAVGAPTGTVIKLTLLRKLTRFTIDKVIDDLAQRFYPAIAAGRSIRVNGLKVPLLADPPMVDVVERRFEFLNGRTATLRAGLLVKPSILNRVHLAFGHRVIKPASTMGCGSYSGLNNIFARVQLNGSMWALTTFKDDLYDEDQREELEDALEAAMTQILMKCGTVSMEARVATIGEMMNDMLPEDVAAARPHKKKKESGGSSGRGERKNGGSVEPDKSDPDGPAKAKRRQKDRLLITWEGNNADHGIGWFDPGRINRVHLSPDNPKILELFNQRDDKFVALATMIIALQMFEQGLEEANEQRRLHFMSFGKRVAQHLETNTTTLSALVE